MLYEKKIPLRFKGKRNYIHGTDMFDNMLSNVRNFFNKYPNEIKGSFHRLLKFQGILRIYDNIEIIDPNIACANFSININGTIYQVIFTASKTPILSSYNYDENIVLDKLSIDNNEARMILKSSYTYIEQIVAVTKQLHLTFYPSGSGNWLFTKIHIRDFIDPSIFPGHMISIKIEKNFHCRLTQSSIFLDKKLLGRIWFSSEALEENI